MFASSRLGVAVVAALACGFLCTSDAHAGLYQELQRSVRASLTSDAAPPKLTRTQIVTDKGTFAVHGKRERKQVRLAAWYLGLQGDRRDIRDTYGHPTFRHYELRSDVRTEIWTYPDRHRTFVFEGDRLIDSYTD